LPTELPYMKRTGGARYLNRFISTPSNEKCVEQGFKLECQLGPTDEEGFGTEP
jgi:hypothetical protein